MDSLRTLDLTTLVLISSGAVVSVSFYRLWILELMFALEF